MIVIVENGSLKADAWRVVGTAAMRFAQSMVIGEWRSARRPLPKPHPRHPPFLIFNTGTMKTRSGVCHIWDRCRCGGRRDVRSRAMGMSAAVKVDRPDCGLGMIAVMIAGMRQMVSKTRRTSGGTSIPMCHIVMVSTTTGAKTMIASQRPPVMKPWLAGVKMAPLVCDEPSGVFRLQSESHCVP